MQIFPSRGPSELSATSTGADAQDTSASSLGPGLPAGHSGRAGDAPGEARSPTAVRRDVWACGSIHTPGTSILVWGRKPRRLEPQRQQKWNTLRGAGLSRESPSTAASRCRALTAPEAGGAKRGEREGSREPRIPHPEGASGSDGSPAPEPDANFAHEGQSRPQPKPPTRPRSFQVLTCGTNDRAHRTPHPCKPPCHTDC